MNFNVFRRNLYITSKIALGSLSYAIISIDLINKCKMPSKDFRSESEIHLIILTSGILGGYNSPISIGVGLVYFFLFL